MVKPSPELTSVFSRLLEAFQEGNEPTVRGLMSPGEHTLIMGTDPREWFRGGEGVELILLQMREMAAFDYETRRIEAFEHDGVGWVAADVVSHVGGGSSVELRMSATFVLEDASWRLVHLHTSSPSPDDPEVIGSELSATMERILDSVDTDTEATALREMLGTRMVTLVFTDIEESTRRTAASGDYEWSRIVARHFDQVRQIAEENHGVLVKTLGDGAMLAFGAAEEAVRAATAIVGSTDVVGEGPPLRLRVGVHAGEAIRREDDFFGQTVNRAARIAAAAQPGQVLVSEVIRSLVAEVPDISFEAALSFELKGVPGVQTLYPVRVGG